MNQVTVALRKASRAPIATGKTSLTCPNSSQSKYSPRMITALILCSKHRLIHNKPYECLADGCFKRFAQKQALDRHVEVKHPSTNEPARFYHCTVDGCKYSSTGRWQKKFSRVDQVKEHIKDYGRYGPHSANDRPRRPGNCLHGGIIINAAYEEWTVDVIAQPQSARIVRLYEYNSSKTKLWHVDDTGELYLRIEPTASFMGMQGERCTVSGCHYSLSDNPGVAHTVLFKTSKALQEHLRRAHPEDQFVPLAPGVNYTGKEASIYPLPLDGASEFSFENSKDFSRDWFP
jgi:hypothetical protein